MPLSNFSNLDFDQVKQSLKDYLQSNSNFTDYDFEGSNLSTILDVLAYNTYITSYNANMVANEVFLDSATLRENVVSIARNIGYLPKSRKSARATVSFFVDVSAVSPAPISLTLKKGPIATSQGTFANSSFIFSIIDNITVPVSNGIAIFTNIPIYEGPLITQNFTINSRDYNQKFILPNSGIDTDLMSVFVRDSETATAAARYSRQDNLFGSNRFAKIYFLQEVEDERYEILFGDGVFGHKLDDGNVITVNYIRSNGDSANGVSNFTFNGRITYQRNATEYTVSDGVSLLTTGISSSGGENIESVESIKKFAPRSFTTQNRAVTSLDYETLIPSKIYSETESISVFGGEELVPPQYGKVFISIKPKFGDFLPNLIKENIKQKLKKYSVAGIITEILDLKYLYVEIDSKIYYNSNLTPSSQRVSSIVQNNVQKYAESTELNRYGARFKYSKFQRIIDDSNRAITSNITNISIRRDLRVVLNTFAEYSIGFGNQFHIKSLDGYNIKSSGFTVSGIQETLYLGDVPNFDNLTGDLFFFTVPTLTSQNPSIVKRNVGTIDYANGVVTLNPVNMTSGKLVNGQPIIEISVTPKSNDVIGLQDLYLQLDIGNSTFDMVVDDISSGVDSSASTYITSSSYATGTLVRSGGRPGTTPLAEARARAGTRATATSVYNTGVSPTTATQQANTPSQTPSSSSSSSSSGSSGGGGYSSGY